MEDHGLGGFDHAGMAAVCRHWANRWVRIAEIQAEFTPEDLAAAEKGWNSYEDEHDPTLKCLAAGIHPDLAHQTILLLHRDADYHRQAAADQAAVARATNRTLEERVADLEECQRTLTERVEALEAALQPGIRDDDVARVFAELAEARSRIAGDALGLARKQKAVDELRGQLGDVKAILAGRSVRRSTA